MVRVEWSNPFNKNTPTELQVKRGVNTVSDETRVPYNVESFKREKEHFVGGVEGLQTVRTTFSDAQDDLRLIADLFRHESSINLIGDY